MKEATKSFSSSIVDPLLSCFIDPSVYVSSDLKADSVFTSDTRMSICLQSVVSDTSQVTVSLSNLELMPIGEAACSTSASSSRTTPSWPSNYTRLGTFIDCQLHQDMIHHSLSFFKMGKVKKQEWQWFPRTKGVVQSPEIPIRKKLVGKILSFKKFTGVQKGQKLG